jgi:hypothetical protein
MRIVNTPAQMSATTDIWPAASHGSVPCEIAPPPSAPPEVRPLLSFDPAPCRSKAVFIFATVGG